MIAIIDYGVGNIKAFANIYHNLHIPCKIARSAADLADASKLILPGVGAFDHAMERLNASGMREKLDELVQEKKLPTIGICVGMQMLADTSEEGQLAGLGWIRGQVKKFSFAHSQTSRPLPHMGWNSLDVEQEHPLLKGLTAAPRFYFLHSYYFSPANPNHTLASAHYGDKFSSVIHADNVYGIQCHPEKSHHNGVRLLENFGAL
jgi:glutamine amidotransferase